MKYEHNQTTAEQDERRWQAVVDRDSQADGAFVYAVKTTGIYCAPACPSRIPNRQNVEFFSDGSQAEAAGYRPCKRCRQGRISLHQQQSDPDAGAGGRAGRYECLSFSPCV